MPAQIRLLPGGQRLHLQDGPIDLVVRAFGPPNAVKTAYQAAARRFTTVLDELCGELPALRQAAEPTALRFRGPIARAMEQAVAPFVAATFITPMAAVAGAVADHILAEMLRAAPLDRAFVNNGGDIALHVVPGQRLRIGMVDRPDRPTLFGDVVVTSGDPVGGVATSGWRGRSFSLGIADSVTVLARSAAEADAAATIIANAVDLPHHAAIRRVPASSLQPDSDLGDRLVTLDVGPLSKANVMAALARGLACAQNLVDRGLAFAAALRLEGETLITGAIPMRAIDDPRSIPVRELNHA